MSMNKKIQILAIAAIAALLTSCNTGSGAGIAAASSYSDLGTCSSANEGVVRTVSNENTSYRCENGTWKKQSSGLIPGEGSSGGDNSKENQDDDNSLVVDGDFCSMKTDYSTYVEMKSDLFYEGYVTVSIKRKGDVATAVLSFKKVSESRFLSICNEWKNRLAGYMTLDASAKCNEDTMKMTAEGEYIGNKTPEKAFASAAEDAEDYCSDLND